MYVSGGFECAFFILSCVPNYRGRTILPSCQGSTVKYIIFLSILYQELQNDTKHTYACKLHDVLPTRTCPTVRDRERGYVMLATTGLDRKLFFFTRYAMI